MSVSLTGIIYTVEFGDFGIKNVPVAINCNRKLSSNSLPRILDWELRGKIIYLIESVGRYNLDRYYIQNLFYQFFTSFREGSTLSTLFTSINKQYTSWREAKVYH